MNTPSPPPTWPNALRGAGLSDLLNALHTGLTRPPTHAPAPELAKVLAAHITQEKLKPWRTLDRSAQHTLCALIASCLRHLQDEARLPASRTREMFNALKSYLQEQRPGFVHGMAQAHQPKDRTWKRDALKFLDQLSKLDDAPAHGPHKLVSDEQTRDILPKEQLSRIRFHGACGSVTGSMTELELNVEGSALRLLFDCGLTQGEGSAEGEKPTLPDTLEPSRLHVVFLTHAHADHCGLLPLLYRHGYRGHVVCSEPTRALTMVALQDAARKPNAAFGEEEIAQIRWWTHKITPYADFRPIEHNVFLRTSRSSHLLGATGFFINWGPNQKQNPCICISGDVGPHTDKEDGRGGLIGRNMPFHAGGTAAARALVLESTYGTKQEQPPSVEERRAALLDVLNALHPDHGVLLIPTFALGRTQEVLLDLELLRRAYPEELHDLEVFTVKSGLSREASRIYAEHVTSSDHYEKRKNGPETRVTWGHRQLFAALGMPLETPEGQEAARMLLSQAFGLKGGRVHTITSSEEFAARGGRRVLVAPSGMGDHGLMRQAMEACIEDEQTHVAIVGWAAASTVCGKLLRFTQVSREDILRAAPCELWPQGPTSHDVMASIHKLDGYGGHAPAPSLMRHIWPDAEQIEKGHGAYQRVFLVHGEEKTRQAFAAWIAAREDAPIVTCPVAGTWYDLTTREDVRTQLRIQDIRQALAALKELDAGAAQELIKQLNAKEEGSC